MSEKKPQPLIPARIRNRCPVCGEVSYSRSGIHPQCSVRKADEKRDFGQTAEDLEDLMDHLDPTSFFEFDIGGEG
jgi:hypothetical protein